MRRKWNSQVCTAEQGDAAGSRRWRSPCIDARALLLRLPLAVCVAAMSVAGCTRPDRSDQVTRGEQVEADAFLHEHLQAVSMVTVGEAYRAMILLADGADKYSTFEEREADLKSRGIVAPGWKLRREEPIEKGSIAYMVQRIIKAERGVNSLIFGSLGVGDRRYALRDMTHLELMQPAPAYRYITGGELVFLVGKADAYMADHGAYPAESMDLRQELDAGTTSRPAD